MKLLTTTILSLTILLNGYSQPYIPLEKNLDSKYVESLFDKGQRRVYSGDDLKYIAMPCGGIGAGEVDLSGDGRLCFTESIYNVPQLSNDGHGYSKGYHYLNPAVATSKIENEFQIQIGDDAPIALDATGFDAISFVGEYPIAAINYDRVSDKLPVSIDAEVFSPNIPLDLRNSATPLTTLKYVVTNRGDKSIKVNISANIKNITFPIDGAVEYRGDVVSTKALRGVNLSMISSDTTVVRHPQYGSLSLAVMGRNGECSVDDDGRVAELSSTISLKPNQSREVVFLVGWYYPNFYENCAQLGMGKYSHGWVGRIYNNWYDSAFDVVDYAAKNYGELYSQTKLYHDTYFDNTLPYWLANRITMPNSTMAAGNVTLWESGRMYAYEGIGFCPGTCSHVFNFVTAISKLFPQMERSVRVGQDFNETQAYSDCGRINFRGYGANIPEATHSYASDAQSGYVLKAYREHLMSADGDFLDSIWDKVKMAMGYQIFKDSAEIGLAPNGVLECKQTFWDPMWYGPNPYNNTLYLAALLAAEQMAYIQGEDELARRYRSIYESGREYMITQMWNGEYFVHLYPRGVEAAPGGSAGENGFQNPREVDSNAERFIEAFNNLETNYFFSTACDANQLIGQNFAHQLGLGYILPKEQCESVVKSIFKYNWTPDIATVYDAEKPKHRTLAASGEGAMVNGAWPVNPPFEFENTHDKSDVWTGLEYEAACDMINEGRLTDAFVVLKSVDDRYDGAKRNPWNEVEGSDHYSRAMHAWNILLSLSGAKYNGPAGVITFSPKLRPEKFKSFFSAAEGWGSYSQICENEEVAYSLDLKYGVLKINELGLPELLEDGEYICKLNGKRIDAEISQNRGDITVHFDNLKLSAGDILTVENR